MLDIKKLSTKVVDKDINILNGLNLSIGTGEVHAIMGPNGTGKSTLAKTIMGHYSYEVTDGTITFNKKDITNMSVDERAKMGIFLSMQDPTVIDGVSNSEFLRTAQNEINGKKSSIYEFIKGLEKSLDEVGLDSNMIHRSLNKDFSGGEKKKNEILQLKVLKPKMIILDELDSGLDVDSLKVVCKNINNYKKDNPDTSILIITHYSRILDYIKPDYVHVLSNGKIIKTGNYELAKEIDKNGYGELENE